MKTSTATLLALTVETVARDLARQATKPPDRLWVCGGGVHNGALLRALQDRLAPLRVESTAVAGIDPDSVEATLFAWLAHERLEHHALPTPSVTGAKTDTLLGEIALAPDPGNEGGTTP